MAAIELSTDVLAADPAAAERATVAARSRGVLTRTLGGKALQVSPSFVISEADLARLFEVLQDAIHELGS